MKSTTGLAFGWGGWAKTLWCPLGCWHRITRVRGATSSRIRSTPIGTRPALNRKDYGISWNKTLDAGGLMIGEEVQIEINAEAVKTTGSQ